MWNFFFSGFLIHQNCLKITERTAIGTKSLRSGFHDNNNRRNKRKYRSQIRRPTCVAETNREKFHQRKIKMFIVVMKNIQKLF